MRPPTTLAVGAVGVVAHRLLAGATHGAVAAVFVRSIYVELDDAAAGGDTRAFVAITADGLDLGPLVARVALPIGLRWADAGVAPGAACTRHGRQWRIGQLTLDLAVATCWQPQPWPATWRGAVVRARLARLRAAIADRWPVEGLSGLVLGGGCTDVGGEGVRQLQAIARVATPAIAQLREWLSDGARAADLAHAVDRLTGLGPGLTPSGDDLLAGAVIALHASAAAGDLGGKLRADTLAATIRGTEQKLTSPLARAFLLAAADGHASAAAADLVTALLAPGDDAILSAAAARLTAVGHSSGWDTLAGIVLVLDALSRADALPGRP